MAANRTITILKAEVIISLPVVCSLCGYQTCSEPIKVLRHNGLYSLPELNRALKQTQIGINFPVGWVKSLVKGKDIYHCLDCKHILNYK